MFPFLEFWILIHYFHALGEFVVSMGTALEGYFSDVFNDILVSTFPLVFFGVLLESVEARFASKEDSGEAVEDWISAVDRVFTP